MRFYAGMFFVLNSQSFKKTVHYRMQIRNSHTYYSDIRHANKELFTELHVYNNVTKPIHR